MAYSRLAEDYGLLNLRGERRTIPMQGLFAFALREAHGKYPAGSLTSFRGKTLVAEGEEQARRWQASTFRSTDVVRLPDGIGIADRMTLEEWYAAQGLDAATFAQADKDPS